MGLLRKLIRTGYKVLSVANTTDVLIGGNPKKIAKHIIRRKLIKRSARIIK